MCRGATEIPPAIRPLVEAARASPPEFFADTIARLMESGRIPKGDLQSELLEDAFRAAAGAKEPVRLVATQATPPDTRAIYRGKAGDLRLDALSLQARILKDFLTVDPVKARQLFDQMVHPTLDARACEDPLLPDLSPYYEAAAAIAQSAFTPAEKEKDAHIQFLLTALSQIKSPAELPDFARSLGSVQLKPEQLELLLATFSKTMESMSANSRSFQSSIDALQSEMETMISHAESAKIGAEALLKAYRKYLVTQLTGVRCNDNVNSGQQAITWIGARTSPLAADEIKPGKTEGVVKADRYFQSADSQQLGAALRQITSADRTAPEWPGRLADFLRDYSAWQPPGDEIDVFHQRATVLHTLLSSIPPGEDRDRIVAMAATLLQSSSAERQSPAEWLWQSKTLLEAAGGDAPKMLAAFRASGDPALMLYAGN
jgi:hypothetical protein